MSRFILLPSESANSFVLVSTEDCMKTKTIELPNELLDMNILKKVQDRSRISKTSDGFVKDKTINLY